MSIRPNKAETHWLCITVEGDKLSYDGPTATQFASLITTKILLKNVVSTIPALFICVDIHNFYYNTPMIDFEYMKLPLSMFPQETIDQYNMKDPAAADGYVYMEIIKSMPGLNQAGRIAINRLTKNLEMNGYAPVPHTLSLWRHHTSDLVFPSLSTTLGSSTHGRQTPITCSNTSRKITRSPRTGPGRNTSASHSSGTTSTEI